MNIDLNIENYSLEDILNLFKLDIYFNDKDLINAKKIVLKTHPDKSGLNKDIFLFYCKAFRLLKNINDFKNKEQKCANNKYHKDEYTNDFDDENNKEIVNKLMKNKKDNFNEWFNKLFEKLNLNDEQDNGYGDWLSNDSVVVDNEKCKNMEMVHDSIEKRRKELK